MRILSDFLEIMRAELHKQQHSVSAGGAKDFADYKYRVGQIKGIETTLEALIDFVKSKPPEERD